jgi:hypothetical protein
MHFKTTRKTFQVYQFNNSQINIELMLSKMELLIFNLLEDPNQGNHTLNPNIRLYK